QDREGESIRSGRWLDDVRNELILLDVRGCWAFLEPFLEGVGAASGLVALPGVLIEVVHVLAAVLLVLRQIVGAAMGDSFKLLRLFGEGEEILDIGRGDRIVRELLLLLFARTQVR